MLSSKQRKALIALSQKVTPIFQIGKNGLSDATVKELGSVLEAREIIKISILKNSGLNASEVLEGLCQSLNAEPVIAIGAKIVLYRRSMRENMKHLEF